MDNKKQNIMLIALLSVIVILMCVSCYLLGVAHGRSEIADLSDNIGERELRSTVVNKDNVDNVSAGMEGRRNGPQSYEVIMNTEWEFGSDGMQSKNAYVENSRDNSNTVRFTVALEDQPDRILYRSPEIPVGSKIKDIKFIEEVPNGHNKAVVTYEILDDRGKKTGEVKAGITLVHNFE